ncbi:MAG: hypothetical protein AAF085_14830 [Planctomycetota bacterium]
MAKASTTNTSFQIRITKTTPRTGPDKLGPSYAKGLVLTTNDAELKHLGIPKSHYERIDAQ